LIAESARARNLLVLRSLTKFFAIPGIRIGYVAGHSRTIGELSRHIYPWNVNTIAQIAAEDAINDKEYIARTRRIVPEERAYMYENLKTVKGMTVYPSCANFFLCKLTGPGVKSATELHRKLLRRGILIRNCGNFKGLNDRFFRVAVRNRPENGKLIAALRAILDHSSKRTGKAYP
jgi:threonine-phosphate decarboxylase